MSRKPGSFFVPHDLEAPVAGAARGPLAGLTAVVKDMYDIVGARTGGGSPEWLAEQKPAARHAVAVQKLVDAGATITGKTICEELFYSMVGINAHYGMPINIRAPGRIPGGSSSGSAAACAAGVCDIALGSDTAGSIRIPASFNGVYGIRVTHGRVDLTGAMAMAPTFDAAGWFASSAGVLRLAGQALLDGAPARQPVTRLLLAKDAFKVTDDPVADVCRAFLRRAGGALPAAEEAIAGPVGFDEWCEGFRLVQAREVWATFGDFVRRAKPNFGPGIKERIAFAQTVTAEQEARGRKAVEAGRRHIGSLLPPGTVMALPTSPAIAPRTDLDARSMDEFRQRVMRLTSLAGLGGLPQVSIPVGTVAGCPVGLSLMGWPGSDEVLLDLACVLARHCGVVRN